jgi:integrase/recombinase XerD
MNFVENFKQDLELRQLRPHTIANYVSNVQHFLLYNPNPMKVQKEDLKKYLDILLQEDLAGSTLKSYFISVNAFYEYLKYEEEIKENPIPPFRKRYLPRKVIKEKRQYISVETARVIIKRTGHIMDRTMQLLFAKSGIRREEMLILKEHDLKLSDWQIKAPVTGKRLEYRPLFLDLELMDTFLDYLDWRDEYATSDYLFINPTHGGKLHKDHPGKILRKIGSELGIHNSNGPLDERLTPHCWRWFFTTNMHRGNMNDQYIKYLRGDVVSKEAWEGYLNLDQDLIRMEYLRCVPKLL